MHVRLKYFRPLCFIFYLNAAFSTSKRPLKSRCSFSVARKMVDIKFTAVSEAKRNIKAVEISLLAALHKSYIPNLKKVQLDNLYKTMWR